jgi:hypothetical protein
VELDAEFEHVNGTWRSTWRTPVGRQITTFIIGDAQLMESPDTHIQLRPLMATTDELIDIASLSARESVYRDEISAANGLLESSIVVTTWDDLKVWFKLGQSGRMLGVRIRHGKPVDVYCDHP